MIWRLRSLNRVKPPPISPLCTCFLFLSSSCQARQLTDQTLPAGDTSPTLTRARSSAHDAGASARAKAAVYAGRWGVCRGVGVAGAIKMAPVTIIIHCLLFLLSSTHTPTPPALLSSSCQGPARHAHQLSPGCSESMGSGGRRLVNSPEAAQRSWRLLKLKCTCKHSYSCWFISACTTSKIEKSRV